MEKSSFHLLRLKTLVIFDSSLSYHTPNLSVNLLALPSKYTQSFLITSPKLAWSRSTLLQSSLNFCSCPYSLCKQTERSFCQEIMSLSAQSFRLTFHYKWPPRERLMEKIDPSSTNLYAFSGFCMCLIMAVPLCSLEWQWFPLVVLCQGTDRSCRGLRMVWAWTFKVPTSSVHSLCPFQSGNKCKKQRDGSSNWTKFGIKRRTCR